jgi:membrane-bound lytic murein transglycosylase B
MIASAGARSIAALAAAAVLLIAVSGLAAGWNAAKAADSFQDFIQGLWPEAQKLGVSRATFDTAFRGVKPDYKLPDLIIPGRKRDDSAGQAEFTSSAMDYLNPKYLAQLAVQGKKFMKQHARSLQRIEKATGVDPYIIVAIW